jgi:hypothetical protein
MLPKADCVRAMMVPMRSKLVDKVLVRKDCSLFESVNAFFDLDVDITIGCEERVEIVLFANGCWEIFVFDAHIFWILLGEARK